MFTLIICLWFFFKSLKCGILIIKLLWCTILCQGRGCYLLHQLLLEWNGLCWYELSYYARNAWACQCILKPTIANIHQYHFNNSFMILLTHFLVINTKFEFSLFQIINIEWWYCILCENVQYMYRLPNSMCYLLNKTFFFLKSKKKFGYFS